MDLLSLLCCVIIEWMHTKEEKNKLFKSFINNKDAPKIYYGIPPKNINKGDFHINNTTGTIYCFNGKNWDKII